jgi:hypothetical protein
MLKVSRRIEVATRMNLTARWGSTLYQESISFSYSKSVVFNLFFNRSPLINIQKYTGKYLRFSFRGSQPFFNHAPLINIQKYTGKYLLFHSKSVVLNLFFNRAPLINIQKYTGKYLLYLL